MIMKKNNVSLILIILLVAANLYQVYLNRTLNIELYQLKMQSETALNPNLTGVLEKPSSYANLEELALQGIKLKHDINLTSMDGEQIPINKVFDKARLVLYFKDVSCRDCNQEKIQQFLSYYNELTIENLIIITNFESQRDFKNTMIETGLSNFKPYNSTIDLKLYDKDEILLFALDDDLFIKYPFLIRSENFYILPRYLYIVSDLLF